jgi:hypothetical protein
MVPVDIQSTEVASKSKRHSKQEPLPRLAYRVNEATQVSGLGRSSIYQLIAKGKLKSVVVEGRRLITAESMHDLFDVS